MSVLGLTLLLIICQNSFAKDTLPIIEAVNQNTITVGGISSGGAFATQVSDISLKSF
jgi:hypothetical protein